MARFIGRLKGNRGEVSRLGTPASGMSATAQGWNVGATIEIIANASGKDVIQVFANGGSNNAIANRLIATITRGEHGLNIIIPESLREP